MGYTENISATSHDDDDDDTDPWRRKENEEAICSLLAAGSLQVHRDDYLSFSGLLGQA